MISPTVYQPGGEIFTPMLEDLNWYTPKIMRRAWHTFDKKTRELGQRKGKKNGKPNLSLFSKMEKRQDRVDRGRFKKWFSRAKIDLKIVLHSNRSYSVASLLETCGISLRYI
jgi:hypothetical protein